MVFKNLLCPCVLDKSSLSIGGVKMSVVDCGCQLMYWNERCAWEALRHPSVKLSMEVEGPWGLSIIPACLLRGGGCQKLYMVTGCVAFRQWRKVNVSCTVNKIQSL